MAPKTRTEGDNDGSASAVDLHLPEELILEIMYHLPIRKAVQWRCLNRGFNKAVSDSRFAHEHAIRSREQFLLHYSSTVPKFFGKLSLHPLDHYPPDDKCYINLGGNDLVSPLMSSSNGRLLIQFKGGDCLYMFNPILGAYRIIPPPPSNKHDNTCFGIGLVDDRVNFSSSSSAFKLVAVVHDYYGKILKFLVFESEKSRWTKVYAGKSSQILLGSSFVIYSQPIYLNHRLHWLLENGDLLVFDLNSLQPEIVAKPDGAGNNIIYNHGGKMTWFGVDTWLGTADGYLAYVIPRREEIVIYGFDDQKKLWRTNNRIKNIGFNVYRNGRPVFWDGKTLILLAGMHFNEIYKFEIVKNKWKRIGALEDWTDCVRSFHPFVPTFVPVPGCKYLHENEKAEVGQLGEILKGLAALQSLFLRR